MLFAMSSSVFGNGVLCSDLSLLMFLPRTTYKLEVVRTLTFYVYQSLDVKSSQLKRLFALQNVQSELNSNQIAALVKAPTGRRICFQRIVSYILSFGAG